MTTKEEKRNENQWSNIKVSMGREFHNNKKRYVLNFADTVNFVINDSTLINGTKSCTIVYLINKIMQKLIIFRLQYIKLWSNLFYLETKG